MPLWGGLICCVVIGSWLPAANPLMVAIGRLHIWDKLQLEAGQHFSPGRAVDLGDVVANGAGVSCGALLGLPIRTLIAIL